MEKVAKLAELPCTPGQSSLKDLITKQLSTSMVPLKDLTAGSAPGLVDINL